MFTKIGSVGIVYLLLLASCGKKLEDSKKSSNTNAEGKESSDTTEVSNPAEQKLYRAIVSNDDTIVQSALEDHSDVDFSFKNGETPLTMAIQTARTEIIIQVLNKTKNINLKNASGKTPLIVSVEKDNLFTTRLIINRGANLDLADSKGMTPLYYALYGSKEELALNLVKAGADLNIVPPGESLPASIAAQNGMDELAALIPLVEAHEGATNRALNNAIKSENHHFVEYLLNNFDSYQEIIQKRNVLITAINIDSPENRIQMLRTLLNRGANPNNDEGVLPLIHAAEKTYPEVVNLLLLYADPFGTDEDGHTALHAAVSQNHYRITLKIYRNMINKASNREGINLNRITQSACLLRPRGRSLRNYPDGYTQYRYISNLLSCF